MSWSGVIWKICVFCTLFFGLSSHAQDLTNFHVDGDGQLRLPKRKCYFIDYTNRNARGMTLIFLGITKEIPDRLCTFARGESWVFQFFKGEKLVSELSGSSADNRIGYLKEEKNKKIYRRRLTVAQVELSYASDRPNGYFLDLEFFGWIEPKTAEEQGTLVMGDERFSYFYSVLGKESPYYCQWKLDLESSAK